MPLITTTDQLKANNGAVQIDLEIASVASFIDDAEQQNIIPAIGYPLYNLLATGVLDSQHTAALKLLQKAVANLAISFYVNFGSIQLSDGGAHVIMDERRKIASDKKLLLLRDQSRADGYRALEFAVNYLENNLTSFPEYSADNAHARNRRFFINTTADFSAAYDLRGSALLFDSLKSVMTGVELDFIEPILGTTVSGVLRAAILNNSTNAAQQQLLVKIAAAQAPLTVAEAIPYRLIQIKEGSITTSSTIGGGTTDNIEETATPSQKALQAVMNTASAIGKLRLAQLKDWLNTHAANFNGYTAVDTLAMSKLNDDPAQSPGIYFV